MANKVVLITGALTGIGRATAIAFARRGANVVVSGRRDEEGNKLAAELRGLGAAAEYIRSDVRHEDDVRIIGYKQGSPKLEGIPSDSAAVVVRTAPQVQPAYRQNLAWR